MAYFSRFPTLLSGCKAPLLGLFLLCSLLTAHADDYADVNRLIRGGQMAEAVVKADQYLAAKPRDPQMRFLKGVAQTEQNKPNEAIATFIKLTEDYPELPEPYNNLAVLYAGQSQFDKARAALEMAIRTNPSYATAHENLGDVYAKLASQAYSKALQLDSSNAAVQPKLALIRELFSPTAKSPKTAAATPPVTTPPATPPKTVASTATVPSIPKATSSVAVALPPKTDSVTAPTTPPVASNPAANDNKDLELALKAWAKAWSGKDVSAYLATYAKDFETPNKAARADWEAERRKRIESKARISVSLENISISVSGNKAVVKFRQDYRADTLSVSSRKTLEWVKSGERWLIVRETTGN